jgi:hypothetical protein
MAAKRNRNDLWSMKKLRLLSLVGITSMALTYAAWAGPHGGGGGFGGGGGGGGRAGPAGGGFRGGGGFGGAPHFSGGPARFGGMRFAGRTGMSPIRPHFSSGFGRVVNSRQVLSNAARNRSAISSSSARASRAFPQRGLNGRTDHIAERHDANWHGDWDRRHAHFDHGRFFVFIDGFWCGLDDGFFPWDYLPYYADDYYPYDYYTADVPQYDTDNAEPAYNEVPAADPTVQAVQTELTQLGYYNGPVDGFFGPATRDAVVKYQIANNLDVTGSLSQDMLQTLNSSQATGS